MAAPRNHGISDSFPTTPMVILIMGVAHTKALVLDLTAPAASKRQKGRIAAYPLLATRGFHHAPMASPQKRQCSPAIGLASIRLYVMVSPGLWAWVRRVSRALERCITPLIVLSYGPRCIATQDVSRGHWPWDEMSVRYESTCQSQIQSKSVEVQSPNASASLPAIRSSAEDRTYKKTTYRCVDVHRAIPLGRFSLPIILQ